MKVVLLKLARLGLALLTLYAGLLVLSLLLVPRATATAPIDTALASRTLYLTEPKYVFLSRDKLAGSEPKLLLLGASNTMAGFKQPEVQAELPQLRVHNLAVGGSNITQVSQIVELVREQQPKAARQQTQYVVGLWYGMFATDAARWSTPDRTAGDTDIDIERYRYGFYRRTQTGAAALLPVGTHGVAVTMIHPYLALDKLARDATVSLRAHLSGKPAALTDEQRNARVITTAEQQKYLAFWRAYMGPSERLADEQFERLRQLVSRISADGGSVLLVDMPIPAWHTRGSSLARQYQERLQRALPELTALPGVGFLPLAADSAAADADFSDEVHPKPRVTRGWAARLGEAVRSTQTPISSTDARARNDHG
ncbi:MAG TPA: hypothetical protein VHP33_02485 [Polyangiaceae bacterium]|nr:hypothetical protein [Polyangiaceae bacterium]